MARTIAVAGREVGEGQPVWIIAEIGINHNGSLDLARKLIEAAAVAGCDAVKFQKRTPEICVPQHQRDVPRDTPWGMMSYLEYRQRLEFGEDEYGEIDRHCRARGLAWFASCWDVPAVDFMARFDPPAFKVASASLTNDDLLHHVDAQSRPIILSTGMSTMEEIRHAMTLIDHQRLLLAHATSTYPCPIEELNLRMIHAFKQFYDGPVGYSGHEVGLQTTLAAVVLGATFVERHITLDRAMWGTDQAASVEPVGFIRLVRDIRVIEKAFGDGIKRVYPDELPIRTRLRGA